MTLNKYDLAKAVRVLPKNLAAAMKNETMPAIFVGGGFLRAIVAGEVINDIDIFVSSKSDAKLLAFHLAGKERQPYQTTEEAYEVIETDNAYTIKSPVVMQIIHRWTFERISDVVNSFDFTICCAAMTFLPGDNRWCSFVHADFYADIAGKRLVYLRPRRNEDAGGSLIRVLKYYERGYRIPLNSLADVIARLISGIDLNRITDGLKDEETVSGIINGLLKEVDPNAVAAFVEQ